MLMNRYMAEFVGTFTLVFAGVGTAVVAGDQVGLLGVGLAFGLAVLVMAYVVGPLSGGHFNPAVSLSMLLTGKMRLVDFLPYVIAQGLGACVAGYTVYMLASGTAAYSLATDGLASNGYGMHSPAGYSMTSGIIAEVLATALLCYTALATTTRRFAPGFGGLAVGLVLALMIWTIGPVTNASLNPVRSLATAYIQGGWAMEQLGFFVLFPALGGVLAALVHGLTHATAPAVEEV